MWQDAVLSGGGVVLSIALLPMLRRAAPAPPMLSSAPLAFVLTAYVVAMVSLGLFASAATTGFQAVAWGVLAVRRMRGG